mgnify:CR=1 FL=1
MASLTANGSADMPTLARSVTGPQSFWRRIASRLWGYDFFISYHWASGGAYAVALAQRLRDLNFDCFLDRAEYAMGDDWKSQGKKALHNTQRLVLVATPEAVWHSDPVAREVQIFTARSSRIIPIVFGDDFVRDNTVLTSVVNCNSPLVWDGTMTRSLRAYARANQAAVVVPFILGGAMGPVTNAGAIAQSLAETMAGCALTQLERPGAPVIFGNFLSSMSLRSGAPTFGTPEPALGSLVMGQLARRLNLPLRNAGNFSTSKRPDGQAMAQGALVVVLAVDAAESVLDRYVPVDIRIPDVIVDSVHHAAVLHVVGVQRRLQPESLAAVLGLEGVTRGYGGDEV